MLPSMISKLRFMETKKVHADVCTFSLYASFSSPLKWSSFPQWIRVTRSGEHHWLHLLPLLFDKLSFMEISSSA